MPNQTKPALAWLLNEAFSRVLDGLPPRLASGGFPELRSTHVLNVFRQLDCAGSRPADLARRAQMSPQAMGELIAGLERAGYVKRASDPADGRVRLVQFAARGVAAAAVADRYFTDLETEWRAALGPSGYDALIGSLATVLGTDAA